MKQWTYPEETIYRKLPVNFHEADRPLFASDLQYQNQQRTMLLLDNVDYLKDVLFQKSSFAFFDRYCFVHKKPYSKLVSRWVYYFHKSQSIDQAVWIIDNWSKEYFHWFTDALPRILLAEKQLDGYPVALPEHYKRYKYITDSLDRLNIRYVFFNKRNVHFKSLMLTPQTAITGNYDLNLINELSQRFVNQEAVATRNIYISRQKANRRKVTNEAEVIAVLTKHHFEVHFFEDYTLAQQIQIMQETKVLMSIHGAGLTNMLFMPKNGKIVELRNETESQLNCFFALASALDHEYYYLTNQGSSTFTHTADITVDTHKLEIVLQQTGN